MSACRPPQPRRACSKRSAATLSDRRSRKVRRRMPRLSPPPCHEADGNGDMHSAGKGKASFSMDEDHCEDLDKDDLHAQDAGANMNFQATQILSAVFDDATN